MAAAPLGLHSAPIDVVPGARCSGHCTASRCALSSQQTTQITRTSRGPRWHCRSQPTWARQCPLAPPRTHRPTQAFPPSLAVPIALILAQISLKDEQGPRPAPVLARTSRRDERGCRRSARGRDEFRTAAALRSPRARGRSAARQAPMHAAHRPARWAVVVYAPTRREEEAQMPLSWQALRAAARWQALSGAARGALQTYARISTIEARVANMCDGAMRRLLLSAKPSLSRERGGDRCNTHPHGPRTLLQSSAPARGPCRDVHRTEHAAWSPFGHHRP